MEIAFLFIIFTTWYLLMVFWMEVNLHGLDIQPWGETHLCGVRTTTAPKTPSVDQLLMNPSLERQKTHFHGKSAPIYSIQVVIHWYLIYKQWSYFAAGNFKGYIPLSTTFHGHIQNYKDRNILSISVHYKLKIHKYKLISQTVCRAAAWNQKSGNHHLSIK